MVAQEAGPVGRRPSHTWERWARAAACVLTEALPESIGIHVEHELEGRRSEGQGVTWARSSSVLMSVPSSATADGRTATTSQRLGSGQHHFASLARVA